MPAASAAGVQTRPGSGRFPCVREDLDRSADALKNVRRPSTT